MCNDVIYKAFNTKPTYHFLNHYFYIITSPHKQYAEPGGYDPRPPVRQTSVLPITPQVPSYHAIYYSAPGRDRTYAPLIKSQMLYQLSYESKSKNFIDQMIHPVIISFS